LEEKDREFFCAQQVEQLYSLAPIEIISSLVNGLILTYIQWNVISHNVLLDWLSALVLLNGLWNLLWYQFRNASRRPLDTYRWSRRFIGGTLASGILIFPASSLPHQIFPVFVSGVWLQGGTIVNAAQQGAFLAYSLPTITPLLVRFFFLGDKFHMAMVGMSLLFVLLIDTRTYGFREVDQTENKTHQELYDTSAVPFFRFQARSQNRKNTRVRHTQKRSNRFYISGAN